MMTMMKVDFYTDGACNGEKSGGWGFYCPTFDIKVCGHEDDTTNNRMELTAIRRVIDFILELNVNIPEFKSFMECNIYTDSAWCIGAITQDWKLEKNLDLINSIKNFIACNNLNVKFHKVKGHSTNENNNTADNLAVTMSNI